MISLTESPAGAPGEWTVSNLDPTVTQTTSKGNPPGQFGDPHDGSTHTWATTDRLPPHSVKAEQGALGCILLASELPAARDMVAKLKGSDFYDLRHREIYTACFCLCTDQQPVDLLTVQQWLRDKGKLEEIGGMSYLVSLPEEAPCAANFEYYSDILKEKARRRSIIEAARRASELAFNEALDPKALEHQMRSLATLSDNVIEKREWFRFYSPSEVCSYEPPPGWTLVGDSHITRGAVTIIAGPPGVGKSRAAVGLAVACATGSEWMGLKAHGRFRTAILQNENGRHRLKDEFEAITVDGLDEFVRVSDQPPFGMAFQKPGFCSALATWLENWKPDLVIFDPWNSAARDDGQRDYAEALDALRSVLPKDESAPALVILAHTRKPKGEERGTGRGLLHDVAGHHILASRARCVFVMHHATDDPQDDRVVWSCAKNNDGETAGPSAWHRRNGLFVACQDFEWKTFKNPPEGNNGITKTHLEKLFEGGKRQWKRGQAVKELMRLTKLGKSACYSALSPEGRFKDYMVEAEDGLLAWKT